MKFPIPQPTTLHAPNLGMDGLATLDPRTGAPPEARLKDAKSAHDIYVKLREADMVSAHGRRAVDEMIDGEPPVSPKLLKDLGQGHRFNLNFGEAHAQEESALTAYNDLTSSVDVTATFVLNDRATNPEAYEQEQVIAEEYHRMLKSWTQYEFRVQMLSMQFVRHGVGIAWWDHDHSIFFQTGGLKDFIIPRMTPSSEEEIEIAFSVKNYTPSQLYRLIQDEQSATVVGWKPEAVKKAIINASGEYKKDTDYRAKWEEFQARVKNNDMHLAWADSVQIPTTHAWVREFDGTISHYIGDEKGQIDEFLFEKRGRFKSVANCFVTFTYGIGNGYYHGIRGLGYKMFNHVQASNRLRNQVLDSTFLASALIVQPTDADDVQGIGMTHLGPLIALSPETKIADKQFQSTTGAVMPVLNDLALHLSNNTGGYRVRAVEPTGQERTKFEVQAQLQHEGVLSTSAMNLFYIPWARLHKEIYRRAISNDYTSNHPGWDLVNTFRVRCAKRGVPIEVLRKVIDMKPVRAIGSGSPGQRLLAFNDLLANVGAMDEVGRRNAVRDSIAARVGYDMVDRYVTKAPGTLRAPVDARLAQHEEALFRAGQNVPVADTDIDGVHLQIAHLPGLTQAAQSMASGDVQDPEKLIAYFSNAIPHVGQHLQKMSNDPSREQEVKEIAKIVDSIADEADRLVEEYAQQVGQQMQDAQKQQADMQAAQAQPDPALQQKLMEFQLKMQQLQQASQNKMKIKWEEAKQRMAIKDFQAAQKANIDAKRAAAKSKAPK